VQLGFTLGETKKGPCVSFPARSECDCRYCRVVEERRTDPVKLARGVQEALDAGSIDMTEAVLISHQRLEGGGGCLCGWNRLGEIYARHVANELLKAGVLAADARDRKD
jgi:hypothetical protein